MPSVSRSAISTSCADVVAAAALDEGHPESRKFATLEEAEAHVKALAMLMVVDHLPAQLHNGMGLVKAILCSKTMSASARRPPHARPLQLRRRARARAYRSKKWFLKVVLSVRRVQMRAFHLSDDYPFAADAEPTEAEYYDAVDAFIDSTNVDGELNMLNRLALDLLIPFFLGERARKHGIGELEVLLRKYWLPFLQESRCPAHLAEPASLIFGWHTRSARRNALVLTNLSPSLSGIFGKSAEMDALQELRDVRR